MAHISYPAWRKRPDRGEIATCDDCAFWRRYVVLCAGHGDSEEGR